MNDMFIIGNELVDFDGVINREGVARSMFDRNVIFQKNIMESTMDYVLSHVGLGEREKIDFGVLISEPVCNPNYSRGMLNELMCKCYQVPALSYVIDPLMSMYGVNKARKIQV